MLFMRIIISCTFGEDLSDTDISLIENGREVKSTFGQAMRNNLMSLIRRMNHPQLILFPETSPLYLFKSHRDDLKNAKRIRDFVESIINQRKVELSSRDSSLVKGGLITLLIQDEVFANKP